MASVLATLPFNTELLQILEDVAAEVSTTSGTVVHWFMTGGGFTRPFWNGVYGPPQEQHDIDVVTTFKADAQKMALVLHEKHPQHRWAVASVPGSSSKSNADSLELLKDYLLNQYMLYRCGGVRMVHRKIEVVVKPDVVDLLRQGILAVNEKILLEKNPPSLTASSSSSSSLSGSFSSEKTSHAKSISPLLSPEAVGALRHCIGHAMKCLLDYPGLTLRGILCEEFFSHFGNVPTLHPIPSSPSPFGMYKTWEQILNAQKKLEEGEYQKNEKKTDKKITWRGFNEKEIVFAKKIWEFYKKADKTPVAPPKHPRVPLPGILEKIRESKFKSEQGIPTTELENQYLKMKIAPPPEKFPCWLSYACEELDDLTFREWMVDQHRSRDPKGGRDVFLRNLVLCKLFVNDDSGNSEKKEIQKKTDENSNFPPRGTQMPAHMCRHLQMHIRESIVALDTTEIRNVFRENLFDEESIKQMVSAVRLATLFHDCGRFQDFYNKSAENGHAQLSAEIWIKHNPAWVPDLTSSLVYWLILNHNLIGRLCRGISEKVEQIREFHANSDTGAMDIDVNAQPSYVLAVDGIYVREKLLECPLPKNLAMCLLKAVYRADMGSVAALRWILPVVELVENLVLQE